MSTTPYVRENWRSYPHGDITEQIVAYRNGQTSFADLLKSLAERDYDTPSRYKKSGQSWEDIDEADAFEPGTTGELMQAHAIGLLSDPEYEAIVSAGLRAHGA